MSDEDNKHDTNYINKIHDANHDARKLHEWARHVERAVSSCSDVVSHTPHWLKMFLGPTSLHRHTCVVLFDFTFLPFYFDLSFPVFFLSFVLMHPQHYTDLDNLDTVENILRHSAKGSNDAYDVPISLTMCEEFETHQDRSGEPDVLTGQSIVLSEIKAEDPLQNENPSYHYVLWQQNQERIKFLSQESKVSKFCKDAGFIHVLEVWQYFMTEDTGDF